MARATVVIKNDNKKSTTKKRRNEIRYYSKGRRYFQERLCKNKYCFGGFQGLIA